MKKNEKESQNSSFSESECSDDALDEFLYYFTCFARNLKLDESKIPRNNDQRGGIKQEVFFLEILYLCAKKKNFSFLLDIAEDGYNAADNFPKEFFQNFEDYLSIHNQVDLFEKNPKMVDDILNIDDDGPNGPKNAKIDEIFAIFLLKIAKHLKVQYFKEMVMFVCLYRKALIDLAKKKIPKLNLENLNADFIIENSNEFILEILPTLLPQYNIENSYFLSIEENKINNAILLTQHFGNWLYACHFTDSKLEINYKDLEKK